MFLRTAFALFATAAAALLTVGCDAEDMSDQPRYEPLESSDFFDDGLSARHPPAGTVPRGSLREDHAVATGVNAEGGPVADLPVEVTPELLQRGQLHFNIVCANCHGASGYGDGMIALRGFPAPPSYHTDRLRNAPAGHLFDVITNGYGKMMSFSDQLTVEQRWAVIAYVRALQLSQHASVDAVPAEKRDALREEDADE